MERECQIVTTGLTDDELAAVSGGYTLNNTMISGYAVAADGGTGTCSAGWDLAKSKVC
jgi:bacteriocin-like protein